MTLGPTKRFLAFAVLCAAGIVALNVGRESKVAAPGKALRPDSSVSQPTVPLPGVNSTDGVGRRALRPLPPSAANDEEPESDSNASSEPVREKEYREAFAAQAAEDTEQLLARAPGILGGEGPDAEKVALLRALHESGAEGADDLVLNALFDLPHQAPSGRVSVPSFLVRYLGQRGTRDASSRDLLERAIWDAAGTLDEDLRRRAASYLAAAIDSEGLDRLSSRLRQEQDEKLVQGALVALAHNRDAQAPPEFFRALGYEPPLVDDVEEGDD